MTQLASSETPSNDDLFGDAVRLRALFDASTDALLVVDCHGEIVGANRTASRLFERPGRELCGLDFDDLEALDIAFDRIAEAFSTRDTFKKELELRDHDSVRYAELRVTVSRFESEQQYLVSLRDVTSRRRMREQLYRADRLASLGTMAAGVAHEINNPLSFIVSNLEVSLWELDEEEPDLDEIREAIERAKRGTERVERIVRDLTNFSHGGLDDSIEAVDIHRMTDLATQMVENAVERKGGELVKNYGRVPPVLANEARLNQVLVNLLLNAAQALPEDQYGENRVEINTRVDEDDRVVVEVRDTGVGIPEAIRDRIFDPFFTTKPVDEGTGIGLAICHEIVQAIGGEISLESEPGEGSRFEVVLPTAPTRSESPTSRACSPPRKT
ncbi:MAG: two-component system sensor histidine kinase NtrB [Persicimonas sp.]